jgi:hypothetical protein
VGKRINLKSDFNLAMKGKKDTRERNFADVTRLDVSVKKDIADNAEEFSTGGAGKGWPTGGGSAQFDCFF